MIVKKLSKKEHDLVKNRNFGQSLKELGLMTLQTKIVVKPKKVSVQKTLDYVEEEK